MENNDIAQTKIGRVFILCSKNPLTGMTTETVSKNAVVNHCTAPAVTLRSRISLGMATAISVSLRITTKAATRRRLMTSRLRPAVSATAGAMALSADRSLALAEFSLKFRSPRYPSAATQYPAETWPLSAIRALAL